MGLDALITSRQNAEKIDDHHDHSRCEEGRSSMDVRDFMMSVGVQDNINIVEPVPRAVPGAMMVGATNDAENDTHLDVNEDVSDGPIIAHLAPDETNFEEMFEERLAARMAHERMGSRRLEVNRSRQVSLVSDDDVVVVADEVKDASTYTGVTKRRECILAMILLLVVAGGVAVYLLLRNNNSGGSSQKDELAEDSVTTPTVSESEAPSFSPLPLDPLVEEMRSWIAPTSEDLLPFRDPSSPQSQALAWLQDDSIAMTPGRSTRTVLERYVLAVLYYSTSGPSWRFGYLSREDVCTWNEDGITIDSPDVNNTAQSKGVFCLGDGESVDFIALMGNKLHGRLPWELVLLTNLESVNFQSNELTGSIPSWIGELTSLESIALSYNQLTGSIPAGISKLTRLSLFWADQNALTGPLPDSFPPLIYHIYLQVNRLTGSIPESWGTAMPSLASICLFGNLLTGTLPSTIGSLSHLGSLWIDNNLMSGTIPTEISQLSSLGWLTMGGNAFTGSLEQSLCVSLPEWAFLSADCDEIDCPCCTRCCYDNDLDCNGVAANVTRFF
jgi:hypothetical protein